MVWCLSSGREAPPQVRITDWIGPVVRINPWEVHISDADFFNAFHGNSKLDKWEWYYNMFGNTLGTVGTGPAALHRARRGVIAKFFSAANVAKLEPRLEARVRTLCDRIEDHRKAGKVVDISNAFRCYATDIVTDYAAPHTRDFLNTPDFSAAFSRVMRDISSLLSWQRHFRIIIPLLLVIPRSIAEMMDSSGGTTAMLDNQQVR
jgi:hypothetical protein